MGLPVKFKRYWTLVPAGYISKNFDAIRNFGNLEHIQRSTTVGEVVDVQPEEAEWTLQLLDDLFDHFYVKPKQAEMMRQALNTKLDKVGKPPMKS